MYLVGGRRWWQWTWFNRCNILDCFIQNVNQTMGRQGGRGGGSPGRITDFFVICFNLLNCIVAAEVLPGSKNY